MPKSNNTALTNHYLCVIRSSVITTKQSDLSGHRHRCCTTDKQIKQLRNRSAQ